MNFKEVTLGEISEGNKGTYGIAASAVEYSENLYTYLRITDINDDGTLNKGNLKSVDNENARKYILKPNDIVFARTGGSTGRSYFYDGSDGEFVFAGFLIKFSLDPTKVNPKYMRYYTLSDEYRGWVDSFNAGSTRGNINAQTYSNMKIRLPNENQQKLLVDTLSCLDEKIELNNKINENLSELLQTVYQQQFGNTKNAGSSGFLADICSYSKDRISVSNLTLNSYYSTENMQPNKAGATYATSLPTTINTTKCRIGDVLVSNIRPYFKKIVYCHSECGCSTDVLCFTPNVQELSAYLFSTLYNDHFFNFMVAGSKGTKMPRGDKQQIMSYAMSIPSQEDLNAFNEVAMPILAKIEANRNENVQLARIRDGLLPKLMSGEIGVSNIKI